MTMLADALRLAVRSRATTRPRPDTHSMPPSGRTIRYSHGIGVPLVGGAVKLRHHVLVVGMQRAPEFVVLTADLADGRPADRARTAPCLPRSRSRVA